MGARGFRVHEYKRAVRPEGRANVRRRETKVNRLAVKGSFPFQWLRGSQKRQTTPILSCKLKIPTLSEDFEMENLTQQRRTAFEGVSAAEKTRAEKNEGLF